jgi:tRNA(Leu) C34 or U34 (ribose-2'-O)-methylase TrmL
MTVMMMQPLALARVTNVVRWCRGAENEDFSIRPASFHCHQIEMQHILRTDASSVQDFPGLWKVIER